MDLTPAALARLDELLAAPAGRRVGVLGLGVAGRAMALLLARRGAVVVGADQRPRLEAPDLVEAGVTLRLGPMDAASFADVEALVVSPGADPAQAAVQAALARGVPVLGELELTRPLPARTLAITGTNGKSTTTALAGALAAGLGARAFVGGNLGDPISAWLLRGEPADVAVVELSSYQLETAYRFAADVAVVLNITPDHFDRYPHVEAYAVAKQRLVENLGPDGVAVLGHDDARVRAMAAATRGRVLWFSTRADAVPGDGLTLAGDCVRGHGALAFLDGFDLAHPRLFGRHNRENALAATAALAGLGLLTAASLPRFAAAYRDFAGLEHRLELVAEVGGVRYINDSKATNDDAAAVALLAMDRPVVLLAGGRDKGAGYDQLVATARGRVRRVIAFGEAAPAITAAFDGHDDVVRCDGMREALAAAAACARPGEAVLLAPACSSFDEFDNYGHRGRVFKELVAGLAGEGR